MRSVDLRSHDTLRAGAIAALLGAAMRLPFLGRGLLADEAGTLAAARAWAHVGVPYRGVWIDRPQGLLLLYRLADLLPLSGRLGVRLMAILAGAVCAMSLARIAHQLHQRALAIAVVGTLAMATPLLEGFAANGELLAAAVVLPGVSLALTVLGRSSAPWSPDATAAPRLVAAGFLLGAAVTIKQSAFDGAAAVVVWFGVLQPARHVTTKTAAALVGGLLIAPVMSLAHGARIGWHAYWFAVAGFRSAVRSGWSAPEWSRLPATMGLLSPLALACAVAVWLGRHHRDGRRPREHGFALTWTMAAVASMFVGGSFWRHYFIALCAPFSILLGPSLIVAAECSRTRLQRHGAPLVLAMSALPGLVLPNVSLGRITTTNRAIAHWVSVNRPDATVYAWCADAGIYEELEQDPPVPYLWRDHVRAVPGAVERIGQLLASDNAPAVVIVVQRDTSCGGDGTVEHLLTTRYAHVTTINGVDVRVLTDAGTCDRYTRPPWPSRPAALRRHGHDTTIWRPPASRPAGSRGSAN